MKANAFVEVLPGDDKLWLSDVRDSKNNIWKVVRGLSGGPNTYSFESLVNPGRYLQMNGVA